MTTAVSIRGGNATIFVSDFDAAFKFYTEVLGLKPTYVAPKEWASLSAGSFSIGLHPAGANAAAPGTAGAIEVGLQVDPPIRATVDALTVKGVKFRGPILDDKGISIAPFGDPDGNRLYLFAFGG